MEQSCRQEVLKRLTDGSWIDNMITIAKLFEVLKSHYYWFSEDEDIRRSNLTDELLQPYKLLGEQIVPNSKDLGNHDVFQMLEIFNELDQSYDGFYKYRAALEETLRKRDLNRVIKSALDHDMALK